MLEALCLLRSVCTLHIAFAIGLYNYPSIQTAKHIDDS